ncbi:hypothetical protein BDW02DRAFT_596967 [Decorospora gaudefroyi]|uniref:Uncharacterized protein n=1 Tax=Decorospora gaudefroyi TaxID=184978 RepID=A0A6A5KNC4_9PLEO|nr:hypothetical protein BDW02DRAFT_596967 [Decorospora gaudefroyi]
MSRNGKRSYVFATKSMPKSKTMHSNAFKKEKKRSRYIPVSTTDTSSTVGESGEEQAVQYPFIPSSHEERSTSSIENKLGPLEMYKHSEGSQPAPAVAPGLIKTATTIVNHHATISTDAVDTEASAKLPSMTCDTSQLEQTTFEDDELKATEDAKILTTITALRPDEFGSSTTEVQVFDEDAEIRKCPDETTDNPIDDLPAAHHPANILSPIFGRPTMTPLESLGPCIMFEGLFGAGDITPSTSFAPPQQDFAASNIAHWTQPEQVPAYKTRSHASWFSNPANRMVRGVRVGTPRNIAGLQRISLIKTVNCPNDHDVAKQSLIGVGHGQQELDNPVVNGHSVPLSTRVSVPASEKVAVSAAVDIDPLLDSVIFCKNKTDAPTWYYREPILEIDPDFSDDEDDSLHTSKIVESICPPSTRSGQHRDGHWGADMPTTSMAASTSANLDVSSVVGSSDTELRSSSHSSGTSASSLDFHMDNTFLGSTSARDLLTHTMTDIDGKISKKALAQAFLQCVAEKHADRRSASPSIAAPGVTFITEADIGRYLDFETQRRAKLGCISLFSFLKKVKFDIKGTTTDADVLSAWQEAALESHALIQSSKDQPVSSLARRISSSRLGSGSESSQSRGRVRTRARS